MVLRFKHSLVGYDPEHLEKLLEEREALFEQKKSVLEQELAAQIHQKEILKTEISKIQSILDKKQKMLEEISDRLYTTYIRSVRGIFDNIKKVEAVLKDLNTTYESRESELSRLRDYIDRMKEEFQNVAQHYELMFGESLDENDKEISNGHEEEGADTSDTKEKNVWL